MRIEAGEAYKSLTLIYSTQEQADLEAYLRDAREVLAEDTDGAELAAALYGAL